MTRSDTQPTARDPVSGALQRELSITTSSIGLVTQTAFQVSLLPEWMMQDR